MNAAGSFLSYENLSLFAASIPLLAFVLVVWIPESPYYLQNCGREAEALAALQFFRNDADVAQLNGEIEEMKVRGRAILEDMV